MRVSHTGTQAGRTAIYTLSRTHTRVTRAERGQRASLSRRASRSLLTRACGIGFACREQLQAGAGARPDKGDLPVPPAGDRGEKVASARPASRTSGCKRAGLQSSCRPPQLPHAQAACSAGAHVLKIFSLRWPARPWRRMQAHLQAAATVAS